LEKRDEEEMWVAEEGESEKVVEFIEMCEADGKLAATGGRDEVCEAEVDRDELDKVFGGQSGYPTE